MRVLEFSLHSFIRISWVSDLAKTVWHPRFNQITSSFSEIELTSVKENLKKCGNFRISFEHLPSFQAKLDEYGLYSMKLDFDNSSNVANMLVGRDLSELELFKVAWGNNDNFTLQSMLGIPRCCQEFLQYVAVNLERNDPTWEAAYAKKQDNSISKIKLHTHKFTNMFLYRLGLKFLHHYPCKMNCADSTAQAKKIHQIGQDLGFNREMDWLTEILSWPVEWSALHGIAETKTPLFKFINQTDATPIKYLIEYAGSQYPAEGARGLSFPYNFQV